MNEIVIFTHSDCLLKDNGTNHPERKERLETIMNAIDSLKNIKTILKESPLANISDICLVHPKKYISNIHFSYY